MTLEEKYKRVRAALEALVGASGLEELKTMKKFLQPLIGNHDALIAMAATDVLIDTHPDNEK